MTRETRIGLLVGLVFIVMFGLVLSELTGKSGQLGSPSASGDKAAPDTTLAMLPVPERREVTPDPALPPARSATSGDFGPTPESRVLPAPVFPPTEPARNFEVVKSGLSGPDDATGPIAMDFPKPDTPVTDVGPVPPDVKKPEPVGKEYVVEAGDTLTKIARKQYGQGHDKDYIRIVKANNLKEDENLKIGAKLIIPPLDPPPAVKPAGDTPKKPGVREVDMGDLEHALAGGATPKPRPTPTPTPKPGVTPTPKAAVAIAPTPTPAPVAKKTYTVKSGDTFSRIAAAVLHDKSAATVEKIRKANPNVDPTDLQVDQVIVLPG